MVDWNVIQNRPFRLGLVIQVAMFFALMRVALLLSFHLVQLRGFPLPLLA